MTYGYKFSFKFNQIETFIGKKEKLFEAKGNLNNKPSRDFLTEFMATFVAGWSNGAAPPDYTGPGLSATLFNTLAVL